MNKYTMKRRHSTFLKKIPLIGIVLVVGSLTLGCSDQTLTPDDTSDDNTSTDTGTDTDSGDTGTGGSTTVSIDSVSVADAMAENVDTHGEDTDYTWDESSETLISLADNASTVDGSGASVSGNIVTISSAGNYRLSGTLSDGQVLVETDEDGVVRLILDGVDIRNASSSPFYISGADKAVVILAEGSSNLLADTENYVFPDAEEDEPDAALFSKDDLSIGGTGSLQVTGNYNEAIKGKDGVIIHDGTITVSSVDDGIQGKDYLVIEGGTFNITAQGDGLKSSNDEETDKGYIYITQGNFTINSNNDAIQAETDVLIADGEFDLTAGGGSDNSVNEDESSKGIKGNARVVIDGGTFLVSSADDALHSNARISINSGDFELASGDDGIHADTTLGVFGGTMTISKSYEGLESAVIEIRDGDIHLTSSDDGINVAGGNDGSGFGRPGQGSFGSNSDYYLYINGGYIVVNASGDGLDANGSIEMTGGTVLVNGPTSNGNGALDYDGSFTISGGTLVAVGSSGMAQAPGSASTQYSVLMGFSGTQEAGTLAHIQTAEGETVLSFAPAKNYQSLVFSSPELVEDVTYEVYLGGSDSGTMTDGLYQNGTYSGGTAFTDFSISSVVTTINSR